VGPSPRPSRRTEISITTAVAMVDPVMAAYAKEIGAEGIFTQIVATN
jgi:hypothetical protein